MDKYNSQKGFEYKRSGNYRSNCSRNYTEPCRVNNTPPQTIPSCNMEQFPPGMAYVPMQQFKDLYEMEKGLQRGTIFSQIDYPFVIGFCARGCGCQ